MERSASGSAYVPHMEERTAFEAWCRTKPDGAKMPLDRMMEGNAFEYVHQRVEVAWQAWKASRKEALEEAAKICETEPLLVFRTISHEAEAKVQRDVLAAAIRALATTPSAPKPNSR